MVIDFRALNANTKKSACPLLLVQDGIKKANRQRFYIKFDLKSGFYQTELTERAQKFRSFVIPQRQYLFEVMPPGLINAPVVFKRAMDQFLEPVQYINR